MRCIRRHKQQKPTENNALISIDDFFVEANIQSEDVESTCLMLLGGEWFYTMDGNTPLNVYFLDKPEYDDE